MAKREKQDVWTADLEDRYELVSRNYGVTAYRRSDGARMGGYRSIEEAAEDLVDDPRPAGGGPNLRVVDRGLPSQVGLDD